MPNVLKKFAPFHAELYRFPSDEELALQEEPLEEPLLEEPAEEMEPGADEETAQEETEAAVTELPISEDQPIEYAKVQADMILRNARKQADEILAAARQEAEEQARAACEVARENGRQEGYSEGVIRAQQEALRQREEQAAALGAEVQQFLERATERMERQMDEQISDLRDLAMGVAEKVVCVSLKSSSEVIARMIQTAIDKRKRKEWVRIYIAECDAGKLAEIPASLATALSALSDRVRIIPVADDEPGTCIIEMPDEIVDASASTQLQNLRGILMNTPGVGIGVDQF